MAPPVAPATDAARPLACFSFDTEEFDIPLEYGVDISMPEQLRIGRLGLQRLLPVLDRHDVRATFFVTASFARAHGDLIRAIADARLPDGSRRHEIASHGLTHAPPLVSDLAASKQALEDQLGLAITGFRAARMATLPPIDVARAGYTYNASENPIWLPGRYCHIFKPRKPYVLEPLSGLRLVHIPASATPLIRLPLFWLALKNFPEPLLRFAARWTLSADRMLNTYAHPWEYADISTGFGLPRVVAGCSGDRLLARLDRFLGFLAPRARFGHYRDIAAAALASNAPRSDA